MRKRIAIVGSSGAGKSTLARALQARLNIEVIHLDQHYWQAGWREQPRDVWINFQRHLVQRKEWIIDGMYMSTCDIRLNAADTIIFLDMPPLLCLWRAIKRHFQYRKRPRPDFSPECLDKLNLRYMKKVFWIFPRTDRDILIEKIRALETQKKVIWLHSRQEVAKFLKNSQVLQQ